MNASTSIIDVGTPASFGVKYEVLYSFRRTEEHNYICFITFFLWVLLSFSPWYFVTKTPEVNFCVYKKSFYQLQMHGMPLSWEIHFRCMRASDKLISPVILFPLCVIHFLYYIFPRMLFLILFWEQPCAPQSGSLQTNVCRGFWDCLSFGMVVVFSRQRRRRPYRGLSVLKIGL